MNNGGKGGGESVAHIVGGIVTGPVFLAWVAWVAICVALAYACA